MFNPRMKCEFIILDNKPFNIIDMQSICVNLNVIDSRENNSTTFRNGRLRLTFY